MIHDPLCPVAGRDWLEFCQHCHHIALGRLDGVRLALTTVDTGGRAAKQLEELLHTLEGAHA